MAMLPNPEYTLTPIVRAIGRNWREALEDASFTDVAFTFDLVMKDGDTGANRAILDWWWEAGPERTRTAGYTAPELPGHWIDYWRRHWGRPRRMLGVQLGTKSWGLHTLEPAGEVRVWPGGFCAIRSAIKGSEFPWDITIESPLSTVIAQPTGPVVIHRHGVSRKAAAKALLAGQPTVPEQVVGYPAEDYVKEQIERLHARCGWIFLVLEEGRVLAISELQVEQPGVG